MQEMKTLQRQLYNEIVKIKNEFSFIKLQLDIIIMNEQEITAKLQETLDALSLSNTHLVAFSDWAVATKKDDDEKTTQLETLKASVIEQTAQIAQLQAAATGAGVSQATLDVINAIGAAQSAQTVLLNNIALISANATPAPVTPITPVDVVVAPVDAAPVV